jgi:pimeloyl-ACP methyl ester carboxylesterase
MDEADSRPSRLGFAPCRDRIVSTTLLLVTAVSLGAQDFKDVAAHRAGSLRSGGARLHYLEWPGTGSAIVLLPGFTLTAHVFDEIGPLLAPDHRVIALTPRGFGESDAPDSSTYTIATLARDLGALLDSLRLPRAILVGHSLGGTVAAHFALEHPDRVQQLVLLDSYPYYYRVEGADSVDAKNPVTIPPFEGDTTYPAVATWLARYRYVPWRPAFETDLRAKSLGAEGARRRALTVRYVSDQWIAPPDLRRLAVPAVEVCARPTVATEYPWLSRADSQYRAAESYVRSQLQPLGHRLCARFPREAPGGQTHSMTGSHYVFFSRPEATAALLRKVVR